MTNWYDDPPTYTEEGETIVVGRPAFVASFYSHEAIHDRAAQLFDAWLALIPPKTALYYSHEESKRLVKLTPKTIAKVQAVLSPKSLAKEAQFYYAKSAPSAGAIDECHGYSFEIYASAAYSGFVYVTFPRDYVETLGEAEVLAWFSDWSQRFGFTHAGAGFGFEVAWFGEQERAAGAKMLSTGLRFHGVRVWERDTARNRERNQQTLDTAAWLTYLDATSIAEVTEAAIDSLPADVHRHRGKAGVVLQAGDEPDPCDTNRRGPAYALLKAVNDIIVPIRTTKWWIHGWGSKDQEKELGWFSRMDK